MTTSSGDLKNKLGSGGALHWGIVACGKISNDFVRALAFASQKHKVVAAATSNCPKRAQEFIDSFGLDLIKGAKAYGSYDELLQDPNVDLVYIGTLNDAHHEIVMKALDCGKHIVCEKSMGATVKQVKEMVAKAQEKRLFLMEAFWSRFFPAYQHIKKIIKSGEFGDVLTAHANFGILLPSQRKHPQTAETPLTDIGCYTIMFGLFAFQGHQVKKVTAIGAEKDKNGSDTWAQIIIEFDNGRHATLYYTSEACTPCWAYIAFEKGQIRLPEWFWCPTEMIQLEFKDGNYSESTPKKHLDFALNDEQEKDKFCFNHSSGLRYEADCAFECLKNGNTECGNMPHAESVRIAEVMEEVRRQLGVSFPQDKQ